MSKKLEVNPVKILFSSKSFAVIGASRDPKKVGHQIFANLLQSKLPVYPVNPSARQILNTKVYDSILEIEDSVDTAIIVVPVQFVQSVVEECISKKIKSVIIISAGFAEQSTQGKKLQHHIAERLHKVGIQLLGPNTLGYLLPAKNINATFAPQSVLDGRIGIISQSGAMLSALFTRMSAEKFGCSFALSLGNKAGLTELDALEYAIADSQTKVIALYLESFQQLPRFFELVSSAAGKKPILVLKGGRTKQGHQASVSHTAALATNDELLKSAAKQFGFVVVETIEQFINSLFFLSRYQSIPENVMIITNAGGPGVTVTDYASWKQLTLAKWSKTAQANFTEQFPMINVSNPLDLLGDAREDRYDFAIRQAQRDPDIEAILVLITQQAVTNIPKIVSTINKLAGKKPLSVALIGGHSFDQHREKLSEAGIISSEYPNDVIDVLSIVQQTAATRYNSSQFSVPDSPAIPLYLEPKLDKIFPILKQYGLHIPKFSILTIDSSIKKLNFPQYAKTANLQLMHKKQIGAVAGVIKDETEATKAVKKLVKFGPEVLFQQVIESELEVLIGLTHDDTWGYSLTLGLGGSMTNIVADRVYIFFPTTKSVLQKGILSTKAGQAIKNLDAGDEILESLLDHCQSLMQLMLDYPDIKELEINPLMLSKKKWWVVDVKLR